MWSNCQHAVDQRFQWSATNQVHSRKKKKKFTSKSLTTLKPLTVWITTNCSVSQFSCSVMSSSLQTHGHSRLPCPSLTPRAYLNSCPLSRWCHPAISFCVTPFSSHLHSFRVSGSFPRSQFFASVDQSIGVLVSASVLSVNFQDWSPLGWTGWISLQSKGLSRVFSNTTVQKHQCFSVQIYL